MKLNKEYGEQFKRFVEKKVRDLTWGKRASVSTTAMNTALSTAMNVCFTTGSLNRTFWLCQRSIATRSGRTERWIYEIMKSLRTLGILEKVGQKVYAPGRFGPSIYRLGPLCKAWFFAFMKMKPGTYDEYCKRKRDQLAYRKLTSDLNLKERDKVAPVSISPSQYSFIPDFRRLIESL